MRDEDPTSFDATEPESVDFQGRTATETIELDALFAGNLPSSGSFEIGSGIWATTFGKVVQILPIPVLLVDDSCNVVVSNQACKRISPNYQKIQGKPFAGLFPKRSNVAKALSILESVFSSRKPNSFEAVLGIEGSRIWGRVVFRPIRLRGNRLALVLIEDLTLQRKQRLHDKKQQAELEKLVKERTRDLERIAEQLRRSKETIEALLNATSDMAFLLAADGTFLAVNEQVAKQFQTQGSGLLGRSLFELAPAEVTGVEESRFHEVINSAKPLRFEEERFGKFYDNNLYPVVDPQGVVIAVAVYVRDITAERKTNEFLMQSARVQAVGHMASGVAHNFNNVLQIVMNGAYEALTDLDSDSVAEARPKIERIIKSASAGADTVRRLQDFAHARTDEATVSGKVFDLSSTVEQTLEILRPYWKTDPEKRGIKISLHPNLSANCLVRGKENEMFEVVVNLIKNAVEALPRGGRIWISTQSDDLFVYLAIQDNGVGIAETNLDRIFEPFWSTKGVDGIGMGLASSYGIIKRHKGEIFAESTPGRRTAFTVKLPLEKKSCEDGRRSLPDHVMLACRILVIDDSEDSVWVLRNGLARDGQKVFSALSGREGIDILKKETVDVVICDLGMPEINGWDVGKALKDISLERGVPKPPFILLTGWGGLLDEKEKLLDCGVDRIVEKPFLVKNLLEIVRDLLGERNPIDLVHD